MLPTYVKPLSGGSVFPWLTADRIVATSSTSTLETPSSISTDQSIAQTGSATLTVAGLLTAQSGLTVSSAVTVSLLTADRVVTTNSASVLSAPASVTTSQAWSFTSTLTVVDANFSITGSSDATKTIRFEADAQSAGADLTINSGAQTADRTISIPVLSGNDTFAVLGVTATWSGLQTFGNSQTIFGLNSGAVELRVNGGNSGSNNGGRCTVWNNGSSILQFGNKSAILGGAYDSTPYFYSNGTVEFADSIRMTDAKNIILTTGTGVKIGTATTQKLGFWNATPVVQPSGTGETAGFTANAGTAVNDASTFTGNVGSTAYRISDIVKALKQAGILAP